MKQLIPYIIIIILLLLLLFRCDVKPTIDSTYINTLEHKVNVLETTRITQESIISTKQQSIDSLYLIIDKDSIEYIKLNDKYNSNIKWYKSQLAKLNKYKDLDECITVSLYKDSIITDLTSLKESNREYYTSTIDNLYSIISIKDDIITSKDTIIATLDTIISIKDEIILLNKQEYNALIKQFKKKRNRQVISSFIIGTGLGYGLGKIN